jgi:hypothetical protein
MRGSAAAIALAAALAFAPLPPGVVERAYSNGVYPVLQRALTGASNRVPFALLDVLIAAAAVWWLVRLSGDLAGVRTRGWRRPASAIVWRTLTLGAAAYLAFLATWGLNYRRLPLPQKLAYDPAAVTEAAALALAERAVTEVNALYGPARAADGPPPAVDAALEASFARTQRALGAATPARPSRPKRTLLEPYFQAAGVDGLTDPFFLETLLAGDLLPFELPFVVAHEWSHLAGYGDEGEANFVGWLTCMGAGDAARYSAWLFLYREAAGRLRADARNALAARLDEGPRADVRAVIERVRRGIRPAVSAAGWRVYDGYLKANRVEAGAASYAEVVRLILGTRFEAGWVPRQRP